MLRGVLLVNAIGLNLYRAAAYDHPRWGFAMVAGLAVWTCLAIWAYSAPSRRTPVWLGIDLAVALAGLVVTPWLKGPDFNATVAGFWVMGAMMAWAIHWRWLGGLVAAIALAATDLVIRQEITQANYGNVFLLLIGGPIVGFVSESLQRSALAQAVAERAAAAAAERARLARVVHDGVLQVLAYVQRRGGEIGGETAELGRLAGDQEVALRALIREQDALASPGPAVDLITELGRLETRPFVTVALPDTQVELPAASVREIVAAVSASLDNVVRHVGAQAPAWVLVEAFADRVEISVRDEGAGIAAGRLEAALDAGRLGVSESIEGRIRDLGGTATLSTGEFGTEWEFVVPIKAAR